MVASVGFDAEAETVTLSFPSALPVSITHTRILQYTEPPV